MHAKKALVAYLINYDLTAKMIGLSEEDISKRLEVLIEETLTEGITEAELDKILPNKKES